MLHMICSIWTISHGPYDIAFKLWTVRYNMAISLENTNDWIR